MFSEKLIVKKIINNNIIIAEDFKGQEIVAIGKGLGFRKERFDTVFRNEIAKEYVALDPHNKQRLMQLFEEIPYDVIELTQRIVDMAQEELHATYNVNLVISLADHINFNVTQFRSGFEPPALVNEEVKRFYKEEYAVGKKALQMINDTLCVNLKPEESTSIAFHLITATEQRSNHEALKIMQGVSAITKIVEECLNITLDEDSMVYSRFIIHLKFFVRRILFEPPEQSSPELNSLYSQVQTGHDMANECANRIAQYVKEEYQYLIDDDERLYLVIHVIRLLEQHNKNEREK